MPVRLRFPAQSGWKPLDTFQVYTDNGTGSVDTTAPLLAARREMFPDTEDILGYGEEPYGETAYGGTSAVYAANGGYGDQPYGEQADGYGYGTPYVECTVFVGQGFGGWKFAVEAWSHVGKQQTASLVEFSQFVSGDEPLPLSAFRFSEYDDENDRITFSFTV